MGMGAGHNHLSSRARETSETASAAAHLLVLCARAAPLALAPFGQSIADSVLPHAQMAQFPEPRARMLVEVVARLAAHSPALCQTLLIQVQKRLYTDSMGRNMGYNMGLNGQFH